MPKSIIVTFEDNSDVRTNYEGSFTIAEIFFAAKMVEYSGVIRMAANSKYESEADQDAPSDT